MALLIMAPSCAAVAANAELTAKLTADIKAVGRDLQMQIKAVELNVQKTVTKTSQIGDNSNTEGMYVLGLVLMVFMIGSKLAGIWHWKRYHASTVS